MFKLTKKIINAQLIPYLSVGKRGSKCKVGLWRIVRAILKRLKTGLQWRELPMKELFSGYKCSWQTVFYYFSKWSKDGSWHFMWSELLKHHKNILDMSSVELDGSHTPVKRGGEAVGYQGRKKSKTTNIIFLTDKQGIPLSCSNPISGNHNDLFEINKSVSEITDTLKQSEINIEGLFMNADAGFDSKELRDICDKYEIIANFDANKRNSKHLNEGCYRFDNILYKERFAVERTNAWLDSFKNLIIRYETKAKHWLSLHYLAFAVILLRKVSKMKK